MKTQSIKFNYEDSIPKNELCYDDDFDYGSEPETDECKSCGGLFLIEDGCNCYLWEGEEE